MTSSAATTLQEWAQQGKLSEVQMSDDGSELTLVGVTLPGMEKVTVDYGGKTCQYSLASIFLQILDPDQSLIQYRQKTKAKGIKDTVKPLDKGTVVGFFLPISSAAADAVSADGPAKVPAAKEPAGAGAAAADASAEPKDVDDEDGNEKLDRKKDSRDRKKDRHDKQRGRDKHRSASSSSKRDRSTSRGSSAPAEKRSKADKQIDPAKLLSNLSVVVGKREIKAQRDAEQAAIHQALSTVGFDNVTQEVLQEFKQAMATTMAHEIPVGNSSSILKAAAGKDLSRILKLYNDTMSAHDKSKKGSSKKDSSSSGGGASSKSGTNANKKAWKQHLVGKTPIIVLPKGMTAPITMVNAYEFFANSKFVPRDKMLANLRASRAQPKTTFARTVTARMAGVHGKVEYELLDNPKSKLHRAEDWDRVVAVVALGQPWQFKDWPGKYNDPVQLFGRTFGFYVGMEGDKVPADLEGWSVQQAKLNRDKRGLDSVTYASFWNALDEWMTIHKPEMLPQPEE